MPEDRYRPTTDDGSPPYACEVYRFERDESTSKDWKIDYDSIPNSPFRLGLEIVIHEDGTRELRDVE